MNYEKTGRLIAQRRRSLGMTQLQLAEMIAVSNRTISKWERGAGFPDVSLLEPLADALGLSVIELLHGEQEQIDASSDLQVREAIRIVGAEAGKKLRVVWRAVKIVIAVICLLFVSWRTYEFFATNGDGFDHGMGRPGVIRSGFQSFCSTLSERDIVKIEVISSKQQFTITDPDKISQIAEALGTIKIGRKYRDWGPESLAYTLVIYASGRSQDSQIQPYTLSFPAFSLDYPGSSDDTQTVYFRAAIGATDAWAVIEDILW